MHPDIITIIGAMAVLVFIVVMFCFVIVSSSMIDRWITRTREPNVKDTIFNAFEEADKRAKEKRDEARRTADSRTRISRS